MNNEALLNKILEMNIQGNFFVYYHILRPMWICEDGGYHHGITGTFFECVMWVIDTFENNDYIPRFLREVTEYLDECGAPDEDAESICSMYDKDRPAEEYDGICRFQDFRDFIDGRRDASQCPVYHKKEKDMW